MKTLRVSRRYIRRRSSFALAVLLLSAISALWVVLAGERVSTERAANISAIDDAFVSLAELSLSFEKIKDAPNSQQSLIERSRIRATSKVASEALSAIRESKLSGRFSESAQRILDQPSLNPLNEFEDILLFSNTLENTNSQKSALETSRTAALASELARSLIPVLLQIKKAEVDAAETGSSQKIAFEILAILTGICGILIAINFVYLPMERFIMRAQKKIEDSRRDAEAASEAKSIFLATMSHEIRTPINGVLGLAELLMDTELDAEQQSMLHTMIASGNSLLRIVNDVLDLSKAEAGKFELEAEVFSAYSLCRDVCDLFLPQAQSKEVSLHLAADTESVKWNVSGYSTAVRQVLVNLVSNAVKFTEKGSIIIKLQDVAADSDAGRKLRISVRDTGIGIAPEEQDRIFEQFTQIDSSATTRVGGTGLGLAISRKLSEAINGRLYVESSSKGGSEFIFEFPVESAPADSAKQDTDHVSDLIFNKRVLVADDNRVNQLVVVKLLESLGCTTKVAANGAEAVELERSWSPDLVLMDVRMPVMDGLEATREIRRNELENSLPAVPIVGLSANATTEDRHAGISAGMLDYLSKPINKFKLAKAMARLWPNGHLEAKEATVQWA